MGEARRAWSDAVYEGDVDAIKETLKNTAVSQETLDWALLEVAFRGKEPALKVLLQAGASPKVADTENRNALMQALAGPSIKCVKTLIPLSDLSLRGKGGFTACMMAAKSKSSAALEALLTPQSALEADQQGWTPLFYASYYDSLSCLARLLPLSDIQARDKKGRTALMVAAARNSMDAIEALLPHIDHALTDHAGDNAQEVAKKASCMKASRYLKAYGAVRGERAALEQATDGPKPAAPRPGI